MQFKIDQYRLTYGYLTAGVLARIECYDSEYEMTGQILFYKEDDPNLEDACGEGIEAALIRFPISRFMDVMTILLNEKPLHISSDKEHGLCYIVTHSLEPTGEQEP